MDNLRRLGRTVFRRAAHRLPTGHGNVHRTPWSCGTGWQTRTDLRYRGARGSSHTPGWSPLSREVGMLGFEAAFLGMTLFLNAPAQGSLVTAAEFRGWFEAA